MSNRWFLIDQAAARSRRLRPHRARSSRCRFGRSGAVAAYTWSRLVLCERLIAPDAQPNLTIGGEQVVLRTKGDTQKGYQWLFATSNDRQVYCLGPFKNFAAHHSPTSQPAPVESMFGPVPSSDKK